MQQGSNTLVRQLVKISASIDNADPFLSEELIVCAKRIRDYQNVLPELELTIKRLDKSGFKNEATSIRKSQYNILDKLKRSMGLGGPGGEGFTNEQKYVMQMATEFNKILENFSRSLDSDAMLRQLQKMQNWAAKVDAMKDPVAKAQARPYADLIERMWAEGLTFNDDITKQFKAWIDNAKREFDNIAEGAVQRGQEIQQAEAAPEEQPQPPEAQPKAQQSETQPQEPQQPQEQFQAGEEIISPSGQAGKFLGYNPDGTANIQVGSRVMKVNPANIERGTT